MASTDERRITAILLKKNLREFYAATMPLYALSASWSLNESDAELPGEGEVKEVLTRYNALKIPRISIEQSLREIQNSTDEFDGMWPNYPPECGEMEDADGLTIPENGLNIPESGLIISGDEVLPGVTIADTGLTIPDNGLVVLD